MCRPVPVAFIWDQLILSQRGKRIRPSHKELNGKLEQARRLLGSFGYTPVDPLKLGADFYDWELFSADEQMEALERALAEVTAAHYRGISPPAKAFERIVMNEERFVFIWTSPTFEKKMYLKFCLPKSSNNQQTL